MTLIEIDKLVFNLSGTLSLLREEKERCDAEVAAVQCAHLRELRRLARLAADRYKATETSIEDSRELFTDPKTYTQHGIRYGLMKGKGKIEFDDADTVIGLIKKKLPEQAATLLVTKESLAAKALRDLTVSDLARIGCTLVEDGEAPFVKPVKDSLDKFIAALLANGD